MMRRVALLVSCMIAGATRASAQESPMPLPAVLFRLASDSQARPQSISHSDFYYTRLKIHRIGSYAMLPLFGATYYFGDKLLKEDDPASWVKSAHTTAATGIGVLFSVNTVTGVWNLVESRHDPGGKTRKYLHTALLVAGDVGFLWAASSAGDDDEEGGGENGDARHHRNVALGAISVSTLGTALMWFWK